MNKRILQKIKNDCRGAVTVFVTLLLIPAILVSGTAVDLARIFTTRSTVQNANQLAANAALTNYNALLKDLYGIYGYMADDPQLASMLNEYIELTVFGKNREYGTGNFQSFFGSDSIDVSASHSHSLKETQVLKQQILEYMKFRGPVILLEQLFDGIEGAEYLADDAEIIENKQDIDEELEKILEMYERLYDAILKADTCREHIMASPFGSIATDMGKIKGYFGNLEDLQEDYEDTKTQLAEETAAPADPEADNASKIASLQKALTDIEDDYEDILGKIKTTAEGIEKNADTVISNAVSFSAYFDTVVTIANDIDSAKERAKNTLDDMERKINNDECSEDIRKVFTEEKDDDGNSLIEQYRIVLKEEIGPMAVAYRTKGNNYINGTVIPYMNDIRYRDADKSLTTTNNLTLTQLKELADDSGFDIDSDSGKVPDFAEMKNLRYSLPETFAKFGSSDFPSEQRQFYTDLVKLAEGTESKKYINLITGEEETSSRGSAKAQRDQIKNLGNKSDEFDEELMPESGAKSITDPEWEMVKDDLKLSAIAKKVNGLFSDPGGSLLKLIDYALILTYDMSMFSCYTTSKPVKSGETPEVINSITNIPMSPDVNYFYQSEWEYLFTGDRDATKNLKQIKELIWLVRFVINYISVWKITEINDIVKAIKAIPLPFGMSIVLGELARAGFVVGETVVDVARITKGYKVYFFKKENKEWLFKPTTMIELPGNKDDDKGMTYENYMLAFFLGKALMQDDPENILIDRSAHLIEWNTINYMENINADESKMNNTLRAGGTFRLRNASTVVGVTTVVDMRMLFLSMGFAQKGINSVVPPKTLPLTVEDYRGY